MFQVRWIEILDKPAKMLLVFLALLGASVASSAPREGVNFKYDADSFLIAPAVSLPPLSVQLVHAYSGNVVFSVTLPSGETIQLPDSLRKIDVTGLSRQQLMSAAEDTRTILEATARLLHSRRPFVYAEVRGDSVSYLGFNPPKLSAYGMSEFDPIRAAYDDTVLNAPENDLMNRFGGSIDRLTARERLKVASITATEIGRASLDVAKDGALATRNGVALMARATYSADSRVELKAKATERFISVLAFVKDAVYESTVRALWTHQIVKVRNKRLNADTAELGIQIAFRAEIQFGAGRFAIMKTLPLVLSIGYNKEKRIVAFRRGIRTESMSAGTAFSLALKVEVKRYRLTADLIDGGDPRPGYGSYRGEAWLPPAPPMLSLVAESGRGFQSEGVSFGLNFADFIPGSYLMNTVNAFEEKQRVAYSAPIPNPAEWMQKFHAQVEASQNLFESAMMRGGRCELLFKQSRPARR